MNATLCPPLAGLITHDALKRTRAEGLIVSDAMHEFNTCIELFDLATDYRFDQLADVQVLIDYSRARWGWGEYGIARGLDRAWRDVQKEAA